MSRSSVILVVLAGLAVPAPSPAQESGVTLQAYYELARARNPLLRAASASVDAAAAAEPAAGVPPDPELQLGIMNATLPGLRTTMPASMAPSVQLMQMLPAPGKLRLSKEIARQTTAMAGSAAAETWWAVRSAAASAFYEVYEADRQLDVLEQTLEWLTQLEQVALTMYSTGGGSQSDVLRAGVEIARLEAELERMRSLRTVAAARLNAVVDRPSDAAVPRGVYAPLPADLPAIAELEARADSSRPLLERSRLAEGRARTQEALARRQLWPDLSVGVQYGRRSTGTGTEHMGSLMLGFTVPVFAGQRQLQLRHEAAAMSALASAELASARAEVRARIGELRAELARTLTLITLYRTEVLPQAEANVTAAFSSYHVGRVDFMTLVDAQLTLNRYQTELYTLLADYGWRIAELEMVLGRELPASAHTMKEET